MIDAAYVAGTVAFFAVMLLYVQGCEALGAVADETPSAADETSR